MRKLLNKPLRYFHRAKNLLCMGIGDEIEAVSKKTDKKLRVAEFVIYVKCPWRFRDKTEILLASDDIYRPFYRELEDDPEWKWDARKRPAESNLFDITAMRLNKSHFPLNIMDISTSATGDIMLSLEGDHRFDIFIDGSRKQEYFRIVDFRSGRQAVFYESEPK